MVYDGYDEKRKYVRVGSLLKARIKLVDDRAYETIKSLKTIVPEPCHFARHDEPFGEDGSFAQLFHHVTDALFQMNTKIDRLIDLLEGEQTGGLPVTAGESIDISGSGMSIVLSGFVKIGQILQITMYITDFSVGLFEAYGRTVWVTPAEDSEPGSFKVGIEFIDISEDMRDRLIEYSFAQQRKMIRQKKMEQ